MLADRINYQVTGANVWKHAPSIAAMSNATMKLHLGATKDGTSYRFAREKPKTEAFVGLEVNLGDRSDIDVITPGGGVLDKEIGISNGIEFVSEPLEKGTEMSGLFSGELDFVVNKKDFDFEVDLYELTPKGEYFQLPPFWTRASYVEDRTQRHLLTPGKRQRLKFKSSRLMSHEFPPGSRVVIVLSVIKEAGRQINYGTGKDVSDETIADAKEPLQVKWSTSSFITLPIWK
jgi:predicted acyl esterase